MSLGKKVLQLRLKSGRTQREVSKLTGLAISYLSPTRERPRRPLGEDAYEDFESFSSPGNGVFPPRAHSRARRPLSGQPVRPMYPRSGVRRARAEAEDERRKLLTRTARNPSLV